jgi:hypothetical protein
MLVSSRVTRLYKNAHFFSRNKKQSIVNGTIGRQDTQPEQRTGFTAQTLDRVRGHAEPFERILKMKETALPARVLC